MKTSFSSIKLKQQNLAGCNMHAIHCMKQTETMKT